MRVVNNTMTSHDNKFITKISHASRGCLWREQLTLLLVGFLFSLATSVAMAADEASRTLDFAEFQATTDGGVEIKLSLSDNAPTPTDFTSKSPAKISLDIPKTKNNLPWSLPLPVDTGGVTNIKAVQANDRTRIVINMDKLAEYTVRSEGKNIFVTIPGSGST